MTKHLTFAAGLCLAAASAGLPSAAQAQSGALAPRTLTVIMPVAPATVDAFVVTPVPGVNAATKVKVQRFGDYDLDKNGVYNPMEFAQALYFLATSDPMGGNPRLPMWDRFMHKGAAGTMAPAVAVGLLNATADEFATADLDNDWRVTPQELVTVSML